MIDIIVPARNEVHTIGPLVRSLYGPSPADFWHQHVNKVIVVDNGSSDGTGEVAAKAGALVIHCDEVGKGQAVARGLEEVITDRVMLCDGDLTPFKKSQVLSMTTRLNKGMVIGAPDFTQNAPWAKPGALFKRLSGVRTLPTWVMRDLKDRGLLYGYTMEVIINKAVIIHGLPITVLSLRGVRGRVQWGEERSQAMVKDFEWLHGKNFPVLFREGKDDDE